MKTQSKTICRSYDGGSEDSRLRLPARACQHALAACLSLLVAFSVGCGGHTQDDIRARAISRKRDPVDAPGAGKNKATPQGFARPASIGTVDVQVSADTGAGSEQIGVAASSASGDSGDNTSDAADDRLGTIPEGLNATQRAGRSAKNMKRIAQALMAYEREHGRLPDQGYPVVSWRVALLPYLGYAELADQYDTSEPWFSDKNKKVLAQIPPVYQSPERRDAKTNYQVVVGPNTTYDGNGESRWPPEDGESYTAVMVEVDDTAAVYWTEPKDFNYFAAAKERGITAIRTNLGGLRGGEFLAMFGDGEVLLVPDRMNYAQVKAMFTADYDGGPPRSQLKSLAYLWYGAQDQQGIAGESGEEGDTDQSAAAVATGPIAEQESTGFDRLCWNASPVAMEVADPASAWEWARGAVAAGLTLQDWGKHYLWTPALQRPSLGTHFAVAYPSDLRSAGRIPDNEVRDIFVNAVGQSGSLLLKEVERVALGESIGPLRGVFTSDVGTTSDRRAAKSTSSSPVSFVVDAGSLNEAVLSAREIGSDVLFYFDTDFAPGGRGVNLRVTVYDIFRGRRLLKTDKYLVASPTVPLEELDDNLKKLKWELSDFVEDRLSPGPWPVRITEAQAKKRVESLAGEAGKRMPLVALTEMRYYQAKGLVDEASVLSGAEKLIGREEAVSLLLGDEKKQRRALREFLPSDDPEGYANRAGRTRNASRAAAARAIKDG